MAAPAPTDGTDFFFTVPDDVGITLRYRILNRGAPGVPLILIGGLASVLEDWAGVDTRLAYDLGPRPVCVFDNRGMGSSSYTRGTLSIRRMAQDTLALAAYAFGAHIPFHVFGVSMGGMIAQELVLLDGERGIGSVCACVLGCTQPGGPEAVPAGDDFVFTISHPPKVHPAAPAHERAAALRRHFEAVSALNFSPHWVAANPVLFQAHVDRSLSGKRPFRVIMAQSGAVAGFDVSDRLHSIARPVLIVHGDRDVVLPPGNGKLIAKALPASRLLELAGVGHIFWHEAPESVGAIAAFLASHEHTHSKL